ncbi:MULTISPECIES: GNAT family N-acetyltransferase [Lactobacillaceae]|uniref:GNAT family N-acetyltransferase n=1 Tax=Lactobacillaceae TaxID=33958 RepID=UPI001456866F|nr:GNAT family N-acetyltransferase [Lactobacillus sp. HBUAS51381]NLR10349.1 N-acetyltransferase [Lactobacillus sp. HBUAS51381]
MILEQTDTTTGKQLTIRHEQPADWLEVERMTRAAFWNLYMPGCVEHYLAHQLRSHADFIAPLDLVLTLDGEIVGNIMYTRARLTDERGQEKSILTFGPLCVRPGYQRRGYGKLLITTSFQIASTLGYDTVVIFGMPSNYVARGFRSCADLHVSLAGHQYPTAMLVKELTPGCLADHQWVYQESSAMAVELADVAAFDRTLPPLKKAWQPSQEEFNIISRSMIQPPTD